VAHADTDRREVALTFHGAGDETLARRVLTLLHDHGAAATVLAVGTWLRQYPAAGRMVVGLGHELGNHTWSHPDLAALDDDGVRVEIARCRDLIAAATGAPGAFFRPSQAQRATPLVRRAAAAAHGAVVRRRLRDFVDPGTPAIRRNVSSVRAGVVSPAPGHPGRSTPPGGPRRSRRPRPEAGHRLGAVRLKGLDVSARPAAAGLLAAAALIALTIVAACSAPAPTPLSAAQPAPEAIAGPAQGLPPWTGLPGMPPVTDPHNVYAEAGAGMLSPAARAAKPLVYVPHGPDVGDRPERSPWSPGTRSDAPSCSTLSRRGTCKRSTPATTSATG
jgi:hypothetical protein